MHSIQSYWTGELLQFAVSVSGWPLAGVGELAVSVHTGSAPDVPPQFTLTDTGVAGACAFDEYSVYVLLPAVASLTVQEDVVLLQPCHV